MNELNLNDCINCNSCELSKCRSNVVLSRGDPSSRLMLIGEAPGAKEDLLGKPFVGRSGKALDTLLSDVGINPEKDLLICNVVKCRPPNNRRPKKSEIKSCMPWLELQLYLQKPTIIVLAGATAVEAVLGEKSAMNDLRGQWQSWKGFEIMPIFHPSYLLRNPSKAKLAPLDLTRKDLAAVKSRLSKF